MKLVPDEPWRRLRCFTDARIGLGRAGNGLPTAHLLDFRLAHALARDSVHSALDADVLSADIRTRLPGLPGPLVVASQATDRRCYLQRPDLGRRLSPQHRDTLPNVGCDVVFVVADGLSSAAVHANAPALLEATVPLLDGWTIGPTVVARHARVALADDIGEHMGASMSVILIGERPGLSSPASLSAYITWQPRIGRQNHERNCISNIRPDGCPVEVAAQRLATLMAAARRRALTGVGLKDAVRDLGRS